MALYTRAYRLDPQWDMALHFMGRALLSLDRLDEAETSFRKRLSLAPRSDMTRFYLACLQARRGRYEEARRLWDELITINPTFSIEHFRRTLPYADPSTFERLVEALKDAGISTQAGSG